MSSVRIPSNAVSDATDVAEPTAALLRSLNLLGTDSEIEKANGFRAAFSGPPQSVAVIEAGLTAAAKWWATGLGASVIVAWGAVKHWWPDQDVNLQIALVSGTALLSAALVIALGYLLASDVRGRAAASVATIDARARLAETMVRAAENAYQPPITASGAQLVALPVGIVVRNLDQPAADEGGWLAIALERHEDGAHKYVVVKGSAEATLSPSRLAFE